MKWPRCSRRWHNQTPLPSHSSSFRRLPARLRNTNAEPAHGACSNACCTMADRPSMPRRRSTGSTASQICGGASIKPGIAAAPPARRLKWSAAVPGDGLGRTATPDIRHALLRFEPGPGSRSAATSARAFGNPTVGRRTYGYPGRAAGNTPTALNRYGARLRYDRATVLIRPLLILVKK